MRGEVPPRVGVLEVPPKSPLGVAGDDPTAVEFVAGFVERALGIVAA